MKQEINRKCVSLCKFYITERIVKEEQHGKNRAEYDKKTLQTISLKLSEEFGKGFSVDNLENMRRFYWVYSNSETLSRNLESPFRLSWSHYLQLIKIPQEQERLFYEIESLQNAWSVRELKRQIQSALYVRLLNQRNPEEILALSTKGLAVQTAKDLVKDPQNNDQIFASRYQTVLPSKEDLQKLLNP